MEKTILVTGATDGIGLETARMLAAKGHHVLLHGRNPAKLERAQSALSGLPDGGRVDTCVADLSRLSETETLAKHVADRFDRLDVLINNAGVFLTPDPVTPDGLDVRFAVNTIAPYLLTRRLLPRLGCSGRVVNVSSAAQSPVDKKALAGKVRLSDMAAYSQSKLALIMWSRALALSLEETGPAIIAVNPGSLLGTKMVKEGFGISGADVGIGANLLTRAAVEDEFETASGRYFDNDSGRFASPHPDALDSQKVQWIVRVIEEIAG